MNKSLKAFLLGYIIFDVNGHKYFRYGTALEARKKCNGSVCFTGYNLWLLGRRCFYIRVMENQNETV